MASETAGYGWPRPAQAGVRGFNFFGNFIYLNLFIYSNYLVEMPTVQRSSIPTLEFQLFITLFLSGKLQIYS